MWLNTRLWQTYELATHAEWRYWSGPSSRAGLLLIAGITARALFYVLSRRRNAVVAVGREFYAVHCHCRGDNTPKFLGEGEREREREHAAVGRHLRDAIVNYVSIVVAYTRVHLISFPPLPKSPGTRCRAQKSRSLNTPCRWPHPVRTFVLSVFIGTKPV